MLNDQCIDSGKMILHGSSIAGLRETREQTCWPNMLWDKNTPVGSVEQWQEYDEKGKRISDDGGKLMTSD